MPGQDPGRCVQLQLQDESLLAQPSLEPNFTSLLFTAFFSAVFLLDFVFFALFFFHLLTEPYPRTTGLRSGMIRFGPESLEA